MTNVPIDPSMNLAPAFSRTQSQKENCLKGQVPLGRLPKRFERGLHQLMKDQREIPGRDISTAFGPIPVKTGQQPVEILIFVDINGRVPWY